MNPFCLIKFSVSSDANIPIEGAKERIIKDLVLSALSGILLSGELNDTLLGKMVEPDNRLLGDAERDWGSENGALGEPIDGGSDIPELRGRGGGTASASNLDFGTAMGAPEKDGGGLTGAASSGDVMDEGGNPVALRKDYNCARKTSIYALTNAGWVTVKNMHEQGPRGGDDGVICCSYCGYELAVGREVATRRRQKANQINEWAEAVRH